MLKISNVTLKSNLILAPLSGTSDYPFRVMARSFGCEFAFYEMLDDHALTYGHKRTIEMLKSDKSDSPIGAQILGCDPERVLEAANIILAHSKAKIMDLNFACPAKKVLKKKAGSYLLKDPKKAGKIVKKLAQNLSLPITVKVRAGYHKNDGLEGLKLAKICQENGASAVFFHGRSMSQGYSGKVNYDSILKAKKGLKIPVFGSGDVFSAELAKDMLDKTKCDGVLIARGAMGSPWIFEQTEAFLKDPTAPPPLPSYEQVVGTAKKHLQIFKDWKNSCHCEERHVVSLSRAKPRGAVEPSDKAIISPNKKPVPEKYYMGHLRKIGIWYSKGLPYSKRAREAISGADSFDEIMGILDKLKSNYDVRWMKR
jgi:tRNA-dihydrouridine synthase B